MLTAVETFTGESAAADAIVCTHTIVARARVASQARDPSKKGMRAMAYRMIDVTPMSGSIGAEIRGADLGGALNQQTFAEIHGAFLEHQVVMFPGQTLAPAQQIAFARRFGKVMTDPFVKSPDALPELMVVIKQNDEMLAFGEGWHSDNSYLEKPPLGSFLYA